MKKSVPDSSVSQVLTATQAALRDSFHQLVLSAPSPVSVISQAAAIPVSSWLEQMVSLSSAQSDYAIILALTDIWFASGLAGQRGASIHIRVSQFSVV